MDDEDQLPDDPLPDHLLPSPSVLAAGVLSDGPPPATLEDFRGRVRAITGEALEAVRSGLVAKRVADRIAAGKIILEMAWGKPAQSVQHSFDGALKHKVFHLNLTDTTGIGARWLAEEDGAEPEQPEPDPVLPAVE